jgi:hypothetical protein
MELLVDLIPLAVAALNLAAALINHKSTRRNDTRHTGRLSTNNLDLSASVRSVGTTVHSAPTENSI